MGPRLLVLVLGLCAAARALGEVYQAPEAFVAEVFGAAPAPRVLWLSPEMQAGARAILNHPPANLRQRYWSDGAKTVWILEETGKEELITVGFVIAQGRIDHVRVLAYRESRGQEVRDPAFLKQFAGSGLAEGDRLDRGVDGISGATLSVHAMERMARLALYFDRRSRD
jgi:hypothetical protein